tara:strand:- start:549 stop:944 length:396 start_codon:yes stop_codon:yes gene_type:complete
MKKLIILSSLLTFTLISFGQTNRYSSVTTSGYKAISLNEVMSSYDRSGASDNILENGVYYYEKIQELLERSNIDYEFRSDLNYAKSYLTPMLIDQKPMSIATGKWRVKKAKQKLKKAIKKYNKRLKKASKS